MWSFGCILYELLKYTLRDPKISKYDFLKQRFLFKATSCFPLTPINDQAGGMHTEIGEYDLMLVILRSLGYQTQNNFSFLSRHFGSKYVKNL